MLAGDIAGTLYNDIDGNAVRSQGENGLANWTVFLDLNANGGLDAGETSALTDKDGNYLIRGVPAGGYRVTEVLRSGWTPTSPVLGYVDVTVVDGKESIVNFMNQGSGGAITGKVWRDLNNDAVRQDEDTAIAGWKVFIDLDGGGVFDEGEPFELTDGNGEYTFSGVKDGEYEVWQIFPAGWDVRDRNFSAKVEDGVLVVLPDFINWPDPEKFAGVSGVVWNDLDGDGVKETGEPGLSGWTVYADLNLNLTRDVGEPSTTTNFGGSYSLIGLDPGNTRIVEEPAMGFKPTSPLSGYQTVLAPSLGTLANVNFGNRQRTDAAIGGVVYVDRDQDGQRDPGEEGMPGITVYLDEDNDGVFDTNEKSFVSGIDLFYTPNVDESGSYRFDHLAAGSYTVRQVVPELLSSTPSAERAKTVYVGPSDDRGDLNLGTRYRPSEIHGSHFDDVNGNHQRDAGESGVGGATIFIDLDRDNQLDAGEPTTTTAADGSYSFVGLATGAYVVRELVPDGYRQTFPQTTDGILWPSGTSNPAVGIVTPSLIQKSLTQGETYTQRVSLTLPTTGALTNLVDVFLLFDDTGSFTFNSPIVRAAFPNIIAKLQALLPGVNLGFGVGRLEEYGNFAAENLTGRPFVLNQPIIAASASGYTDAQVLSSIQEALNREAPGYGGDTPETVIEALFQMVTGAGFDGNNNGSTLDSGRAGLATTQVTPGSSGDVPPFSSFTADVTHGVLQPSGTIGGAGFRSGALPIIITATDTGFAYQPKGETSISGVDGLSVPVDNITFSGRGTTPFDSGAGIQETVTGLNALGALVIGLGTNPDATSDPRIGLEALAKLTGAINRTSSTIANGTVDPIAPGDPFYFMIGSGGDPLVNSIADGIVAAIQGAVTAVSVNVTLRSSDPGVAITFTPGVINGLTAGATATFDVTFTGDGRPHRFDLQFVRAGTDVVLGSIPVVLGTPIPGDGYEFEDCDDGEQSHGVDFGVTSAGDFAPNVAPQFTKGADQLIDEDAGQQVVAGWASAISPGPPSESAQVVQFILNNDHPSLFSVQPTISPDGTLSYTPQADAFGVATVSVSIRDDGGTAGGGVDTSGPQTFTITINAINDLPTLDAIADQSAINEDDGVQTVALAGITAGGFENQPLAITATSDNPGLIPNPSVIYTDGANTALLQYTPVADQNGTAKITVIVRDAGFDGVAGNADDGLFSRSFLITVIAVNDPPTFAAIGIPNPIPGNAGMQTIQLSGITAGGGENQGLTITATSSNPALVPNPSVQYTSGDAIGSLAYAPALNQSGSATITVTVRDAGLDGVAGNDDDLTFSRSVDIAVYAVTDIVLHSAVTNGASSLTVTYEILNEIASPFALQFFRTHDHSIGQDDVTLATLEINKPADLAIGTHTMTYTIGSQVPLPGVGIAEVADDYSLIVIADPSNAVIEDDLHNTNEDNTVAIVGAYTSGSTIYLHGGELSDTITLTYPLVKSGSLTLGIVGTLSASYSYSYSSVTQFRLHAQGGDDLIKVVNSANLPARAMFEWGGNGDDILNGSANADALWGGAGDDSMSGGLGNDSLDGGTGLNSLVESANVNFTLTNASLVGVGTDSLVNVQVANLSGGISANTFTLSGWTGAGKIVGGGAADTIIAAKNADFTLRDQALLVSDGMNLTLSGIAVAKLTGGVGDNVFDVGGWSGTATVAGGIGNDTIAATRDANMTLAATSLVAPGYGNISFAGVEVARLEGGAGNNLFTVSGWNGTGSVAGGGGSDAIIASKNANFTLSDSQIIASTGLSMNLVGLESANLTGGSSNNTFTVSGWSGGGSINGSTGTDQVVVVRDTDMTLTNTALQLSGVGAWSLVSVETASLTGGDSDNRLNASAFTLGFVVLQGANGDDVLIGGSKNDTLSGGSGRDLLIGFAGADTLAGDAGDDILIGGSYSQASNASMIDSIMAEWTSANPYATRVNNLLFGGGLNGTNKLAAGTVSNDAGAADKLSGGVDLDWFFQSAGDLISDLDLASGELKTTIT